MKKFIAKNGYTAYKASVTEVNLLGGYGICDECGKFAESGFLIPVLNHYMCPNCFKEWETQGEFYSEDVPIEMRRIVYFESKIPLDSGVTQS